MTIRGRQQCSVGTSKSCLLVDMETGKARFTLVRNLRQPAEFYANPTAKTQHAFILLGLKTSKANERPRGPLPKFQKQSMV